MSSSFPTPAHAPAPDPGRSASDTRPPIVRLWRYADGHRGRAVVAAIMSVLNTMFDIAPPFLIGIAVDIVVVGETSFVARLSGVTDLRGQLVVLAGLTVVVWLLESLTEYVAEILWRNLAQTIEHEARLDAYAHVQAMDPATSSPPTCGLRAPWSARTCSCSTAPSVRTSSTARPDATDAEVEAAARIAEAHDFVVAMPEGYDTVVGERGQKLSGGQRQRLSIARALLADPAIPVLDEATSAVDNETEAAIQRSLARVTHTRTTLVIAHRLSTIRHADRIHVLHTGEVVAAGTHEELLALGGRYAALWRVQTGDAAEIGGRA